MGSRLRGRNAVVTGGATGMGLEVAKLFGAEGARLIIMDIDESALAEAERQLRFDGIDVKALRLDVTDAEDVAQSFAQVTEHFAGTLHILINNAGIAGFGNVETTEPALWHRVMAVNATGTYLCSRAAIPAMKEHGGSIVNFGSVAGLVGIPNMAAYCAAKAAVIGLTRQMAAEYSGQGIRVNCVCPGTVADTRMGRQILDTDRSDEAMRKRLMKYPLGRFGKPQEIAAAVLFLASDEASFVCGAAFSVDGGMTAV
ncbi:MAG: SDR family NAD(P)-dependent oxidoreductase [Gammaproteobacteria bacterium]